MLRGKPLLLDDMRLVDVSSMSPRRRNEQFLAHPQLIGILEIVRLHDRAHADAVRRRDGRQRFAGSHDVFVAFLCAGRGPPLRRLNGARRRVCALSAARGLAGGKQLADSRGQRVDDFFPVALTSGIETPELIFKRRYALLKRLDIGDRRTAGRLPELVDRARQPLEFEVDAFETARESAIFLLQQADVLPQGRFQGRLIGLVGDRTTGVEDGQAEDDRMRQNCSSIKSRLHPFTE